MDRFITCVVKAQRADGYIHTPVIIEELNKGIDTHTLEEPHKQTVVGTKVGSEDEKGAFANRLNFETYNLGHLMMAAIVHRRATGKTTLLMQPFVPPISFVISMKPLPLNWPVTLSVLPIIWG